MVKCGNQGSVLYYNNTKIKHGPFPNTRIVDTIGAGDSFNAGFISKFIEGDPPEECQEFGNLMGAISTTQAGGTEAFKNMGEIMEIAEKTFNYSISRK